LRIFVANIENICDEKNDILVANIH